MRVTTTTTVFLCSMAIAAACRAAPFDPAAVPADARYVLHVDMDALRPTQLWAAIDDRLVGNEAFGAKMGLFEQGTGMHFPRDLHAVTVYGRAAGDDAAVIVIRAKMNRSQFMAALQFADHYAADTYGKYDVASWDDDQRPMFGAFHDDATLIFTRSADLLHAALDVMDGRLPHVAPADPLAAGAKPPAPVYVAATDLPALARPGGAPNPIVKQIDHAWLTVNERAASTTRPATAPASADALLHLAVTAKSADAAQQLLTSATGLRAVVGLSAAAGNADPNIKFAAVVLRTLALTQAGRTAAADVSVPVDQLERFADRAAAARTTADK